jgi:Flp pilus assembly protein TadD
MTFFTLASFLCFLRWRDATTSDRGKTAPWLAGSLLLYALAQLTKETAIVFPAVVFGSAFFIDQRRGATWKSKLIGAFRAMAPYLLVAALYLVVRVSVLGRIADSISSAPLSELLFTLPGILLKYLQHLLFPVGLSPFYDTPYITSFSWASVGLPLTLIFFAGAGLICWSRRSIVVPIAIVWMIFPLLPVLNLSLLPEVERFHDRFLYLPSVGFVLLFGLAVSGLKNSGPRAFGFPVARIVAAILVCGPLALGTVFQSSHWRDDVRLFRRASIIAPGNDNVLNNFSAQLIKSGRPDEAEVYLRRVIERSPNHALSLFNLGTVNVYRGEYAQAEHFLLLALETSNNPDIYINLGFVHWRMGRLEDAEKDFRAAISYSRNRPGYGKHLGVLLRHQGRLLEALEVFETELSIDPGQLDVRQQIEQLRARINTQ